MERKVARSAGGCGAAGAVAPLGEQLGIADEEDPGLRGQLLDPVEGVHHAGPDLVDDAAQRSALVVQAGRSSASPAHGGHPGVEVVVVDPHPRP